MNNKKQESNKMQESTKVLRDKLKIQIYLNKIQGYTLLIKVTLLIKANL